MNIEKVNEVYTLKYNAIIAKKDYDLANLEVWRAKAIETGDTLFDLPTYTEKRKRFIDLCDTTNSKYKLLESKSRKPDIVFERQCVCYIAFKFWSYTKKEIGRYLDRDHSTIIHSIDLIDLYVKKQKHAPDGFEIFDRIIQESKLLQNND